jgi:GAF domain-containing protein
LPPRKRRRWQVPHPPLVPVPATASDLEVVSELAHAVSRASDPAEAFQFALDRACPAVGATLGAVFVLDGVSELMQLAAEHAWPDRWRPWLGDVRVRLGFGPSGEAASERRLIEVPDVFADPNLEDWQEVAGELGFRALVAVPLEASTGVVGTATFYFAAPGAAPSAAKALMRTAADLMAVIAELDALRTRVRRAEAALEDERPAAEPRREDTEATGG